MTQSAEYVSSRSRAPVYGLNNNTLGHGIIGGALNNGYYQGREAAKIAQEVLRGVTPSQIGIRERPDAVYQFDHKQLRRWDVDTAALPAGSIIVNQPQPFYETYKNLILDEHCIPHRSEHRNSVAPLESHTAAACRARCAEQRSTIAANIGQFARRCLLCQHNRKIRTREPHLRTMVRAAQIEYRGAAHARTAQ
jgi:hypothetical protein